MKNQKRTLTALNILKNRMGMSLIEILIALGMVGVLSTVIATVMEQMQRAQTQVNVSNTLETMRLNIQKLATDGTAWRATVQDNLNGGAAFPSGEVLNCVKFNQICTHSAGAQAIVSDETTPSATLNAAPFLNLPRLNRAIGGPLIDTVTDPAAGFTDKGTPCTGFSMAGNDACPIQWRIKIAFECQVPPTCLNPTIRVIGVVFYRRSGLSDQRVVISENKYRVDIRRGAQGDTRSERFRAEYTGAGAGPGNDAGNCVPSRVIPYNITLNENGNVTAAGGGVFNFQAGTYTCTALSTCFACQQVHLELQQNGTPSHTSVTLSSKKWEQTQVNISNASFTINATTPVRVVQFCGTVPGNDATLAGMTMGYALPAYTAPTKFAEFECTRIF